MIYVTGNTFPHRYLLGQAGGYFNREHKRWEFRYLSLDDVNALRSLVGVMVIDTLDRNPIFVEPDPSPPPSTETLFAGDDPSLLGVIADDVPRYAWGFSSLAVMCDYIDKLKRPRNRKPYSDLGWSEAAERHYKTKTNTLDEAVQLARYGWTDGLGLMEKFDIPYAINKRSIPSLAGGRVNVGRLLSGNPVHMTKRKKLPKHRTVRLYVDFGGWIKQSFFAGISRALIVAGIIDVMERLDYRCEVIAVYAAADHDHSMLHQFTVYIKAANERLNMLDLTFACGHPAFAGRLKNAFLGTVPASIDYDWRGYHYELFPEREGLNSNEYYFPPLTPQLCRVIDACDDPMQMLPYIAPDDLPIDLRI